MANIIIETNPLVKSKFKTYPGPFKIKLKNLRKLILETANELGIAQIEETLKWGEPSYLVKNGSTIRIDWKEKTPHHYAIYFKCTSKLVESFKIVYGDLFNYENTRAIILKLNDRVPKKELKNCIAAALQYHKVKSLPKLGLS